MLTFDINSINHRHYRIDEDLSGFYNKLISCKDEFELLEFCYKCDMGIKVETDMAYVVSLIRNENYVAIGSSSISFIESQNPMLYFTLSRITILWAKYNRHIWLSKYFCTELYSNYIRNYCDISVSAKLQLRHA